MKQAPGYLLQTIENVDYLLPYGQLIAEHKRPISLNESGVYLWNLLEHDLTREELLSKYLEQFLQDAAQKDALTKDLNIFLNQLISLRIIEDDTPRSQPLGKPYACLQIAGLTLAYYGPGKMLDASNLKDFCVDSGECADQTISFIWGTPIVYTNDTVVVRNDELMVCERDTEYLLIFPTLSQIHGASISKDGKSVCFYCELPVTEELSTQFFHACRFTFLYLAQLHDMYAIHSVSIDYRGRAWLFSASSGSGKSTHANLWKELYQTTTINGDLNLLAFSNGCPVIHGIPWCGTSEIFDKRTYPLGGIILLKQSETDTIAELSPGRKTLLVMQRFISPAWTEQQLKANLQFAQRLSRQILICQLQCTKNTSAAELMKSWIDQNDMAGE